MKNMTHRQKAELYLGEYEKVEEIAAYLSRGFSAYVNVDGSTGEVDFALLTTSSRWNYDCGDHLTHIIPAFEGVSPEMVNDYIELWVENFYAPDYEVEA